MMRHLIAILLAGTVACNIHAQTVVKGRVSDRNTGEFLTGVYVIYGDNLGTSTDDKGYFSIKTDAQEITLTFQFIGYKTVTRQVQLKKGETLNIDIQLETETHLINQVVVSADRIEHKISELTVSVSVIKADFLSRNHITEAAELITKTSGIEVLDGQASIRGGSGFSYGVGSRVMALVDGLPLLSPDAGGIRWQYLPVENLSQVEIIKGASSVLYGSSALNGIINFRTADASNIPVTKFFTEAGIYCTPQNKEWKWWTTPRVFSTLSFSHLRKEGNTDIGFIVNLFTDNSYRKFNDEKLGKASLKIKHFSRKTQGLNYGVNLTAGLTEKTDFLLWGNAKDSALIQDTSSVSFLHGRFLAADPFISYGKPGRFRHDFRMRIQSSENRFPVKIKNNAQTFAIYSEYQLWYKFSEILGITAGLSETWNKINSNFFGDHNGVNLAAFGQAELNPAEKLKLVAGVRAEKNILDSDADKLIPVFRAGVNWQAADYTFLRLSFGQGYRFPSIAEKHASTTLGSVTIFPNPKLQSESGWSTEAGIKQGIMLGKVTGQADLSVFFSQNKNFIEYLFGLYPGGLGFRADNIEQSRIYGTEIEFLLNSPAGNLNTTLSGGYTFVMPVDLRGGTPDDELTYLKYRRKHSFKLNLNNTWKRIESDVTLFARSKILNIDDVFINPMTREAILPGFYDYWLTHNTGYFAADISMAYNINRYLKLSLALKNATNTEYMGRPADIQPPRNISMRLSGKF